MSDPPALLLRLAHAHRVSGRSPQAGPHPAQGGGRGGALGGQTTPTGPERARAARGGRQGAGRPCPR
eukprot:2359182-Alexandrium_andersonii.AAC.1